MGQSLLEGLREPWLGPQMDERNEESAAKVEAGNEEQVYLRGITSHSGTKSSTTSDWMQQRVTNFHYKTPGEVADSVRHLLALTDTNEFLSIKFEAEFHRLFRQHPIAAAANRQNRKELREVVCQALKRLRIATSREIRNWIEENTSHKPSVHSIGHILGHNARSGHAFAIQIPSQGPTLWRFIETVTGRDNPSKDRPEDTKPPSSCSKRSSV